MIHNDDNFTSASLKFDVILLLLLLLLVVTTTSYYDYDGATERGKSTT